MIADFAVNKNGDLVFQEIDNKSNAIKLMFSISKTKACKVSFNLEEFIPIEKNTTALKVKFDIAKKIGNKSIVVLKEDKALSQLLTLKLKTTLGELPLRPEFGSKVSLLRHKEINNENLRMLEQYIKECIEDIVSNPIVEAVPYIDYSNGYTQTVLIKIYNNEKKLLNYVLES